MLRLFPGRSHLTTRRSQRELRFKGKVGKEVSIDDAKKVASICVVNALGHLELELGSLENIKRIVKVTGYVNCESSFTEHPRVVNGASDLLLDIFGDLGRHTRVAVGTNSLPLDSPVELDMIVEIRDLGGDTSE